MGISSLKPSFMDFRMGLRAPGLFRDIQHLHVQSVFLEALSQSGAMEGPTDDESILVFRQSS